MLKSCLTVCSIYFKYPEIVIRFIFDGFVKSQDLTPSHKDRKVSILILNEFFLRVLSAFVRKYSFYEFIIFK